MKIGAKWYQYLHDEAKVNPNVKIIKKPFNDIKNARRLSATQRKRLTLKQFLNRKFTTIINGCKSREFAPPQFTRDEFINNYITNRKMIRLFELWKHKGCKTDHIPSCDRINPFKTYSFENIQVVTWRDNYLKAVRIDIPLYRKRKEQDK